MHTNIQPRSNFKDFTKSRNKVYKQYPLSSETAQSMFSALIIVCPNLLNHPDLSKRINFCLYLFYSLPTEPWQYIAWQPSVLQQTIGQIVNTVKTLGPPLKAANTQKLMGWGKTCLMNWMDQNIQCYHIITNIYWLITVRVLLIFFGVVRVKGCSQSREVEKDF